MRTFVITSGGPNAGKTAVILGIGSALLEKGMKIGYLKPFGDRLVYEDKEVYDHDAALINHYLKMGMKPGELTLAFNHERVSYQFGIDKVGEELRRRMGFLYPKKEIDVGFLEGGGTIDYGSYVELGPTAVASYLGSRAIHVVRGTGIEVLDNISFTRKYMKCRNVELSGVIINRAASTHEFEDGLVDKIEGSGVHVLGIIPEIDDLDTITVRHIADHLYARVVAGEAGLDNVVKRVFVGAMSASSAQKSPLFRSEGKMIITGGDRDDMVLASLDSTTAAIVLTNNIVPGPNILAQANSKGVPILSVPGDTFAVAKKIEDIESLVRVGEDTKVEILKETVKKRLDLSVFD